jgi:hypothetical protein
VAGEPLTLPAGPLVTPSPDGTGQMVHPDVYDAGIGQTWNGHRYWMAVTPYTDTMAYLEAVCILVSDDKRTWSVPAGLTNPITDAVSDPDMVNVAGIMNVIYRHAGDTLYLRSSSDGITWSDAATILTGPNNSIQSPAVVFYGGQWLMFTVKYDSVTPANSTIERRTCATLTGTWSDPITCTIEIPAGKYAWHLDVIVDGATFYMALNLSANSLYLAQSADGGESWTVGASSMITPYGIWDTNIYRSTLVRTATGFDVWYSANNGGSPKQWYVGYVAVVYP